MVGETNRAPFDLPEAEGELVGGFHTEYSSMRFAMFFMAEYMNMITVSALATTLFLGGYRAPIPFNLIPALDTGYWGLLWFLLKVLFFLFIFVWLRGTLPRLRYDQFMRFGWRWLIPISLVWIVAVATFQVARADNWFASPAVRIGAGRGRDRADRLRLLRRSRRAGARTGGSERASSTPSPAATRCLRRATRCCPSWRACSRRAPTRTRPAPPRRAGDNPQEGA